MIVGMRAWTMNAWIREYNIMHVHAYENGYMHRWMQAYVGVYIYLDWLFSELPDVVIVTVTNY